MAKCKELGLKSSVDFTRNDHPHLNFHCAISEVTGFLRCLCKQEVQESSNPLVLLKILKDQYPMTGLLGSIVKCLPQEYVNIATINAPLWQHFMVWTKNRTIIEITGSTRLIFTGAREHGAFQERSKGATIPLSEPQNYFYPLPQYFVFRQRDPKIITQRYIFGNRAALEGIIN